MKINRQQVLDVAAALGYATKLHRPDLTRGTVVWGFTDSPQQRTARKVKYGGTNELAEEDDL